MELVRQLKREDERLKFDQRKLNNNSNQRSKLYKSSLRTANPKLKKTTKIVKKLTKDRSGLATSNALKLNAWHVSLHMQPVEYLGPRNASLVSIPWRNEHQMTSHFYRGICNAKNNLLY
jgi:hypothetical protein